MSGWEHRPDRPVWHPDDCNGPCCWRHTADITDPVDEVHAWSCSEVAIIRGLHADASRRVDALWREFADDCERLAQQVKP